MTQKIKQMTCLYWNNRVVEKKASDGSFYYEIHEVYYNGNSSGIDGIDGITEEPVAPFGESLEELKAELQLFIDACDKPIINYEQYQQIVNRPDRTPKKEK